MAYGKSKPPVSLKNGSVSPIVIFILILSYTTCTLGCEQRPAEYIRYEPRPVEYIIGAHYYPNYDILSSWGDIELTPLVGKYDSADPLVAEQHIKWAKEYGVDVLAPVWGGRQDQVDCHHGGCGREERNIMNGFLQARNINEIQFCIHYDVQWRKQEGWSFDYNFDDEWQFNTFVDDFAYFADTYFGHPSYFKINGRPVVWVLFTLFFRGDFGNAILEARRRVQEKGYDVYIIGDAIWWWGWADPDKEHIKYFDAVSSYNLFFYAPLVDRFTFINFVKSRNIAKFTEELRALYKVWKEIATSTHVAGRDDYVDFQPGIIPRIWRDFGIFRPLCALPLESKEDFMRMATMARDLSEPALDTNRQIIWITSWNEWWERTAIEPTEEAGKSYPYGNLGFDLLEVIKQVFMDTR